MFYHHLLLSNETTTSKTSYCKLHPPVRPSRERPNPCAPPDPSPSPSEHVLVLIIIRSVRMLGRLTLGATTPHASLRRRLMESVHFLDRADGMWGGNVQGDPKAVLTRLWWFGAISCGRLATLNSSANKSSTLLFFFAEHSTNTQDASWELQYETASSAWTVLEGK